jgi:transcriptional regulator with XRE-family HTH domain
LAVFRVISGNTLALAGASMAEFGDYIRKQREKRKQADSSFSVRQVATRIGVEPSFLSKVERNIEPPPSEEKIIAIADDLDEDADVLLAMAGKVSSDLKLIICKRPALFANLIRELKSMPNHAVLRLVREVRDGDW